MFRFYKTLWKITGNRRWLLKCIDILNEEIYNDILQWRKENERLRTY